MALYFPSDCITPVDRIEYTYRCQELLRLWHNEVGTTYREKKITKEEWDTFQTKTFLPANHEIANAMDEARTSLKNSTKWNIDIKGLFDVSREL